MTLSVVPVTLNGIRGLWRICLGFLTLLSSIIPIRYVRVNTLLAVICADLDSSLRVNYALQILNDREIVRTSPLPEELGI
jgi:hypothetical protein